MLWAILHFFLHRLDFYCPVHYPMHKKVYKNLLNFYLLKFKEFHGESVVNFLLHKLVLDPYQSGYNLSQLSMSTRTQSSKLTMPNQWARCRQLSMSTRTQASKLSMPNQWAQSCQLIR